MEAIDHDFTEELVCPHCGHEEGDSWEVKPSDEDLGLLECSDCGKGYYGTRNITVDYCTEKAKYGTCKSCKSEDVVIEDYYSSLGSYSGLCVECGDEEKRKLEVEYFEMLQKNTGKER